MAEQAREVVAVSTHSVHPPDFDSLSVSELARWQGVRPVTSLDELARDVFSSDDELEEFIAYTYVTRRHDTA